LAIFGSYWLLAKAVMHRCNTATTSGTIATTSGTIATTSGKTAALQRPSERRQRPPERLQRPPERLRCIIELCLGRLERLRRTRAS
jgi:hypothetical protein